MVFWSALALAVVGGVITSVVAQQAFAPKVKQLGRFSDLSRLTLDSNSSNPTVSGDGKLVAYVSAKAGKKNSDIWVQQASGGSAIRVTQDAFFNDSPVFSYDASKIYFRSTRNPPGIYEVPTLGGDPRLVIANAATPNAAPDGKSLSYRVGSSLFVRPTSGGSPRLLSGDRSVFGKHAWSPDSTRIIAAAVGRGKELSSFDVWIFPIDGSEPTKTGLTDNPRTRLHPTSVNLVAWLPDNEVLYTAGVGAARNLWRIPLSRVTAADPIPVTLGAWDNGDAAVGGRKVVFSNWQRTSQIWGLPADLKKGKVLGDLRRVTPRNNIGRVPGY
jgi:Tol biopolymer transport system component